MNVPKMSAYTAKDITRERVHQLAEIYRMVVDWYIQEAASEGNYQVSVDVPYLVRSLVVEGLVDDHFKVDNLETSDMLFVHWEDVS